MDHLPFTTNQNDQVQSDCCVSVLLINLKYVGMNECLHLFILNQVALHQPIQVKQPFINKQKQRLLVAVAQKHPQLHYPQDHWFKCPQT